MYQKTFIVRWFVILISLLFFTYVSDVQAQKLSPEEIIAKHVASIGKTELIRKSKLRMAIGSSDFVVRDPPKKAAGRIVLASNGTDMAFFSTFNMRDYPMERIGVFGNKINIPVVDQGRRSPLGSFLNAYDKLLNNRIFGGCIFSTWIFLQPESFGGKFETEGKKKVGDREAWVLRYTPKGGLGSESFIRLYFDAENFHHLRTVYRQKETEKGFANTSPMGSSGGDFYGGRSAGGTWDADMAGNGSTISEDFEDIRTVDGLTLPHKYTILLTIDGASGTHEFKWNLGIDEYRSVKDFPADFFTFKNAAP